jgi:hypothetical protein
MPISKTKLKNAAIAAKSAALPSIPKELLDRGMTVREIRAFLADQYDVDVSPEFIREIGVGFQLSRSAIK